MRSTPNNKPSCWASAWKGIQKFLSYINNYPTPPAAPIDQVERARNLFIDSVLISTILLSGSPPPLGGTRRVFGILLSALMVGNAFKNWAEASLAESNHLNREAEWLPLFSDEQRKRPSIQHAIFVPKTPHISSNRLQGLRDETPIDPYHPGAMVVYKGSQ